MIRCLIPGAAMLALAACTQGAETEAANEAAAAAAANLAETLPNELGGDDVSDANLSNGADAAPAKADD
jgi:hypothetical protein